MVLGTTSLFGHGLLDFNPVKAFPNVVLTWIWFPGFSGFLYKRSVLEQIGSLVDKQLISHVLVNDKFQIIEFKALLAICFAYGQYGHVKGSCPFEMVKLNLYSKKDKTIPLKENVDDGGGFLRPLDDCRIKAMSSMASLIKTQVELGIDVDVRNTEAQIGGVRPTFAC
ncbi:hypothetical protein J1N35_025229 [Gossypium stocksii]|uniref:DUF4283 domain-containing protein n=1 Tax=Gossypium stocksii TaxID=47602 RepID=A0A9D3ZXG4_9ROSI|nr:hypothetical protein J1N35_025229 [Gossypium stocksii]